MAVSVKAPLGPQQERWLSRIRFAGGSVELELYRRGGFSAWILVEGGSPIRLPMRMFESLLDRDLFFLIKDEGTFKVWKLDGDEERESSG